ncbi:pentatricopeptide repeat-containing protein-like protein [Salvia divinorum]|uniref:Pentatricopeptide repeat-containing protein-like protein n=1 Tax=Salvia divinorum TaxID=28513 RepID=A0ABD1HR30_SALDI
MKRNPFQFRKLLGCSYSSSPHSIQLTTSPNPFFPPSGNHGSSPNRSGRDADFIEIIEHLCQQKRLKDVIPFLENQVRPPPAAYSKILQLCIEKRALNEGKRIHDYINRSGFLAGVFISNKILELYCKCGSMSDARKLFDEMGDRDLCSWNTLISGYARIGMVLKARELFDEMSERDNFSWTAMISGYVKHKQPEHALELYRLMQRNEHLMSNKFTVSSVLTASAAMQSLRLGKEIHGRIIRTWLDSDAVVSSALMDVYGKCGSLNEARYIFDRVEGKDIVAWTAMIDRYFGDGRGFERVRSSNCRGVRQAGSALVHMYAKCGSVERADKVFKWLPMPDLVSWTSLINGYAQSGQPHEALKLFDMLLKSGTQPDHVTFVGVLSACTHAGLVDKGLECFHLIKEKHGLLLTADHYACVVDLLSRSGRFKEAQDMIRSMPMKPDKFLWASLLGGCRIHGNYEIAEQAAEALFEIEPENAATYVTLANIYATAGKWNEVAKVRQLMDERGVVKKPGMSWVNINRKVHIFLVGDESHPKSKDIFKYLGEISKRMKEEGFVSHTNYVLHDVEEEQKEQNLSYHSEKLAVAFGIISTPLGTPIKVFKNLRTCVDCHTALKFVSRIAERKITVRDSSRFHCFESGRCSCQDYW